MPQALVCLIDRAVLERVVCNFLTDAERVRLVCLSRTDALRVRPTLGRPKFMSQILETAVVGAAPLLTVNHVIWDMSSRLKPAHARLLFSPNERLSTAWFNGVRTLDLLSITAGETILDDLLAHVFRRVTRLRVWDLRAQPPSRDLERIAQVDYRLAPPSDLLKWQSALPRAIFSPARTIAPLKGAHATYAIATGQADPFRFKWRLDRVYERHSIVSCSYFGQTLYFISVVANLAVDPCSAPTFWAPLTAGLAWFTRPDRIVTSSSAPHLQVHILGTEEYNHPIVSNDPATHGLIGAYATDGVVGHMGAVGMMGPVGMNGINGLAAPMGYSYTLKPPKPEHDKSPTTNHTLLTFYQTHPSSFSLC